MSNYSYWWKEAVIYELYIDRFAGDVRGLIEKLEYFNALGVTCLHILPHYPSPMVDDGYDVSDYRGVRGELGTLDEFRSLVQKAKAAGIRVIIDFPLNHTSDRHPWFIEARKDRTSPKRDYYLWSEDGKGLADATNAFPHIKPSNWILNPATNDYYYAMFYPEQPDLNWDNPDVRREMLEIMYFWAEMGVSGFRLDAVPFLMKREGSHSKGINETHDTVRYLRKHLEAHYPDVVLLAEARQGADEAVRYFGSGDECHLAYLFPLQQAFLRSIQTGNAGTLESVIENVGHLPKNCAWATFLGNHDELYLSEMPMEERAPLLDLLDPQHEYSFKFGRTAALRLASLLKGDTDAIRAAFSLLMDLPGTPVIYYGDEIGMKNTRPAVGERDTRRCVRGMFDWDEAGRQMSDSASLWRTVARNIKTREPHAATRPSVAQEEALPPSPEVNRT